MAHYAYAEYLKSKSFTNSDENADEESIHQENTFLFPRDVQPVDFLEKCKSDGINIRMNKGTTTCAFIYQGGIIVAVDSRATAGPEIASSTVMKIIEINSYMLGTMAGGAADCSFWERYLAKDCRLYELKNGVRITVSSASKILSNILRYYQGMGLSMGTMICGHDIKGPAIYYVENDGVRFPTNLMSVGSGSTYAYGILDTMFRHDMTFEEAVDLGKRAIYHATYRDTMSGGIATVCHIDQNGWKKICSINVSELHDQYSTMDHYSVF
ncbi:Proteasome subunit beta type-8 [Thelohanellus kitauei]|uniref:Proteasome subunit beta n=1 Tax=Thelohanellus kitauei TaxID=669202 RepID=A0A0C2MLP3_THEKT|nr:Proteasome subunit beta type-8 [Thelohanellus kitauei]